MSRLQSKLMSIGVCLSLAACGADAVDDAGDPDGDGAGDPGDPGDPGSLDGEGGGGDPRVDPVDPTGYPRIYVPRNEARLKAALAAGTPAATRWKAKVDEWVGGASLWGFEAWNAALAGALTADPRYCAKAIDVVDAQVTAAEAKIAGNAAPEVAHDSYLHVGEMLGDVARVYDWCHGELSSSQRTRWVAYANTALFNLWHPTEATWGSKAYAWSGWSLNNPENNYHYSFLRATMLIGLATRGENPKADDWLAQFRSAKIGDQLVPKFNADLVGGASREGTGYGVSLRKLFELYDLWKQTTGEDLAGLTPHTKASLVAFMHQVLPTLDRVSVTGDQTRDKTAAYFDYHRNYLQELAHLYPTDAAAGRAKTLNAQSTVPQMTQSFMLVYDFLYDNAEVTAKPLSGLHPTYYARGIGQLYARTGWDEGATWVNLIAGPYTESHAHQDQGSIMIYKGGWLAYDSVIDSRSGINQDTGSHGLVRIDSGGAPIKQSVNTVSTLAALHEGDRYVYASADVTAAYKGNPAVQKVQRDLLFVRPDVVIVYDRVDTAAGTTQTWQLPTPVSPAISGNTATISNAGHTLKVTRLAPGSAALSRFSYASTGQFTGGYRIDERIAGGSQRFLHVLSLDGGAASVAASGANGATVNLAGGGQLTVTFNRDGPGATLKLDGSTVTLGASVDTLPK